MDASEKADLLRWHIGASSSDEVLDEGKKHQNPSWVRRCVASLLHKGETDGVSAPSGTDREAVSRAFAICRATYNDRPKRGKSWDRRAAAEKGWARRMKQYGAALKAARSSKTEDVSEVDLVPPASVGAEAARGLRWRAKYGRGGTVVGVARARDLANGRRLSPKTVRRMVSYFARHEVDKKAEGFREGEVGFPSAGRIAWQLWGSDAGRAWAIEKSAELRQRGL